MRRIYVSMACVKHELATTFLRFIAFRLRDRLRRTGSKKLLMAKSKKNKNDSLSNAGSRCAFLSQGVGLSASRYS